MIKKMDKEVKVTRKSIKVKDILRNIHFENSNNKNHLLERFAFCCARYFYVYDQMDLYFKTAFRKEIVDRYLERKVRLYYKFIKEYCRINYLDWQTLNRSYNIAHFGLIGFKGSVSKNTNGLLYLVNKALNPDFIEMMDQCYSIISVLFGGQYKDDYISTLGDIRSNIIKIRNKINGFFNRGRIGNIELKYKINGAYIFQAFYNATLWYLKNNHYDSIIDTKSKMHINKKYACGKFCKLFPNNYDIETVTTYMERILNKGLGHVTKYTTYMANTYESCLSDKRFTLIGVNERTVVRDKHILVKRFSSVRNLDIIETYGDELFSPYSNQALVNKLEKEFKVFAAEVPMGLTYDIPVLHSETTFKGIPMGLSCDASTHSSNITTLKEIPTISEESIAKEEDDIEKDVPEVTYNLYFFTNKYVNLSDIVDKAKYKIRVTTTERINNEILGVIRVERDHDTYKVISHNIELNDATAYKLFRHYATSERDLELDFDGIGIFKEGEFVKTYKI